MKNIKKYSIWFILWVSLISTIWFAANSWSLGSLFTKISWNENGSNATGQYRLEWTNIKDWTVTNYELANNSV